MYNLASIYKIDNHYNHPFLVLFKNIGLARIVVFLQNAKGLKSTRTSAFHFVHSSTVALKLEIVLRQIYLPCRCTEIELATGEKSGQACVNSHEFILQNIYPN